MRFTTCTTAAFCVVFALSSAVLGQGVIASTTEVIKPVPSCPPICIPGLIERSCVRGRCVEKRVVCVAKDIFCPH
ncbi:hypothetical protein B0H10DRAFT_1991225, partial [Mycena sp. CBHHK59/15]